MPFIPHTDADVRNMLGAIGASSIEELFDEIPAALKDVRLDRVPQASGVGFGPLDAGGDWR